MLRWFGLEKHKFDLKGSFPGIRAFRISCQYYSNKLKIELKYHFLMRGNDRRLPIILRATDTEAIARTIQGFEVKKGGRAPIRVL